MYVYICYKKFDIKTKYKRWLTNKLLYVYINYAKNKIYFIFSINFVNTFLTNIDTKINVAIFDNFLMC